MPLETMRGWFETACRPTGLRQLVGRQVLDSLLSDRFWTACCPTGLAPVPLETMRGWLIGLMALAAMRFLGRLIGVASKSWFEAGRQVVYCRPVKQLPGQKAEV